MSSEVFLPNLRKTFELIQNKSSAAVGLKTVYPFVSLAPFNEKSKSSLRAFPFQLTDEESLANSRGKSL